MKNYLSISKKIKPFKKTLEIEGDKSLSIRWALIASQATGTSTSRNLLRSEDVLNIAINMARQGNNKEEIINKTGLREDEVEAIYTYYKK